MFLLLNSFGRRSSLSKYRQEKGARCMKIRITIWSLLIITFMGTTLVFAETTDHSVFTDSTQCLQCHGYEGVTMEQDGKMVSIYVDKEVYDASVHASVDCLSCHQFTQGVSSDPTQSCGTCHSGAVDDYQQSVHQNSSYGPSCTNCHGEAHGILPADNPASPVHKKMIIETCGDCHGGVIESYQDSFHGKAVALGAKDSPDCTGCHGAHKVLSKNDPLSMTHPDQKPQLCGECHGNGAIGVNAKEHYTLEPTGYSAPMYWINKAFMWLILLVVGFFLIHIILDLLHRLRTRKQ